MLRAVLDANLYVSAAIRPEGPPGRIIERFLREATSQIVLSSAIAEEVLRALADPKVRQAVRGPIEPELWFEDLVLLADLVSDTRRALGVCADPDDDKYISAALEGRATCVVTGDRQLLALREHEGIRLLDPRAFLDFLDSRTSAGRGGL